MDLDGTITPYDICNSNIEFSFPWWVCYLLTPFLWARPKKQVIEKMRLMRARGDRLIIVPRWPEQFFPRVKQSLILRGVPFDGLVCVGCSKGANERKLEIIKTQKIAIFVDSDPRVVAFMRANSINAVTSLDEIIKNPIR